MANRALSDDLRKLLARDKAQALAEQGDAKAQHEFGLMNIEGEGMPSDFAKAAQWFRKAADQEYADAQLSLGMMYVAKSASQDAVQAAALMWRRPICGARR